MLLRFIPVLLLVCTLHAHAQSSVLFIGNSYTTANDLPNTLRQLALSLGDTLTVASSAPGGFTLQQHASHAPTLNAIEAQPWDFVVMQEQSQLGALPVEATSTEPGMLQLMAAIEANHECTYPVLYMTWGRENGDAQFCPNYPYMCTYQGMQQALQDNYTALANWNDAWTAPVGAAWRTVRASHPGIGLYQGDGSHPSMAGTYLAACVLYAAFFQESCTNATFNASLDAGTAAILRSIASATVLDEPETWNLDAPNGTDALLDGFELGPDYITLIHHGQGTHFWSCSNGQAFTTGTVTFTFASSGTYTVVHTYHDPCGNTDTVTLTFDVAVTTGIETTAHGPHAVVAGAPGLVIVHEAVPGDLLTLFDLQGRVLVQERIGQARTSIPCPAGLHGWLLVRPDGTAMKGKVLVP